MLQCVAVVALALLAFGTAPHAHDEADGQGDHCSLCHAQDAPVIASGPSANPDPAVRSATVPVPVVHAHGTTPMGGGSRAPPA